MELALLFLFQQPYLQQNQDNKLLFTKKLLDSKRKKKHWITKWPYASLL